MSRPLLSLVMILKDEVENIRPVLEAVKPWIDRWTILDTGSTDGTQDVVRETLAGVPGQLFQEPFVDFATSRNRVMDLDVSVQIKVGSKPVISDDTAIFQLMLSADEQFRGGPSLREHLEAHRETQVDCHFLQLIVQDDDRVTYSPRVFRAGSAWRYKHKVHEYPVHTDENALKALIPGASIEHASTDGTRRLDAIWEKHVPLLKAELEEDPFDVHALMALAQSYRTLVPFMEGNEKSLCLLETMHLYLRRLALPGGEEERAYAQYMFLDCARQTELFTHEELLRRATELSAAFPRVPDFALLAAIIAAARPYAPTVYAAAVRAANIAAENTHQRDSTMPVSMSACWRAHLMAAGAAKAVALKKPEMEIEGVGRKYADVIREHVAAGVQAGGPWPVFKQVLEGLPE